MVSLILLLSRDWELYSQLKFQTCAFSECGSTVAMRSSTAEVTSGQSSSSSGPCFSNPGYHTVAQCTVLSTISSNLDSTLTLKVAPLFTHSLKLTKRNPVTPISDSFYSPALWKEETARNGERTATSTTSVSFLLSVIRRPHCNHCFKVKGM